MRRQPAAPSVVSEMAAFPELNPGPVARVQPDGGILLANAAARALFEDAELRGHSWLELCPGLRDGGWERVLAMTEGETLQFETQVRGRVFVFTYRRAPGTDSVFVYGNDITERKLAEQLAADREKELRELARFPDMNPGPVCRTEPDGTIVLANAAFRALFGGDALMGACWQDLCSEVTDSVWQSVLATTDVVAVETLMGDRSFVFQHQHDPETELVFIYGADVTQLRTTEEALRQSEKMATLGTLAAGVAHELNNPAAAAKRSADQLRNAVSLLQETVVALGRAELDEPRAAQLLDLARRQVRQTGSWEARLDPLARSDREAEVEDWLDRHGIDEPWEYAPTLVAIGYNSEALADLRAEWREAAPAVVSWLARLDQVHSLVDEMSDSTERISEIVKALKTYSYLGQAPIGPVDVVEGIESTLVMLQNKLKAGVTVIREYEPELPRIQAFGSDLNQVWTNIIDNAAYAMEHRGRLTIRTRRERGHVLVEFEDDGPGMSDSVRQQVFNPFFTTKPPGQGSGLGLSTSHNIVVRKHRGEIDVDSRPGCTRFVVRLPLVAGTALRDGHAGALQAEVGT